MAEQNIAFLIGENSSTSKTSGSELMNFYWAKGTQQTPKHHFTRQTRPSEKVKFASPQSETQKSMIATLQKNLHQIKQSEYSKVNSNLDLLVQELDSQYKNSLKTYQTLLAQKDKQVTSGQVVIHQAQMDSGNRSSFEKLKYQVPSSYMLHHSHSSLKPTSSHKEMQPATRATGGLRQTASQARFFGAEPVKESRFEHKPLKQKTKRNVVLFKNWNRQPYRQKSANLANRQQRRVDPYQSEMVAHSQEMDQAILQSFSFKKLQNLDLKQMHENQMIEDLNKQGKLAGIGLTPVKQKVTTKPTGLNLFKEKTKMARCQSGAYAINAQGNVRDTTQDSLLNSKAGGGDPDEGAIFITGVKMKVVEKDSPTMSSNHKQTPAEEQFSTEPIMIPSAPVSPLSIKEVGDKNFPQRNLQQNIFSLKNASKHRKQLESDPLALNPFSNKVLRPSTASVASLASKARAPGAVGLQLTDQFPTYLCYGVGEPRSQRKFMKSELQQAKSQQATRQAPYSNAGSMALSVGGLSQKSVAEVASSHIQSLPEDQKIQIIQKGQSNLVDILGHSVKDIMRGVRVPSPTRRPARIQKLQNELRRKERRGITVKKKYIDSLQEIKGKLDVIKPPDLSTQKAGIRSFTLGEYLKQQRNETNSTEGIEIDDPWIAKKFKQLKGLSDSEVQKREHLQEFGQMLREKEFEILQLKKEMIKNNLL